MEFILENTNIYDENIEDKINMLLKDIIRLFEKHKYYEITVNYAVKTRRFKYSDYNKRENVEMYNTLKNKLQNIGDCFINYGINAIIFSIDGNPAGIDRISIKVSDVLKQSDYKIYNIMPEATKEEREEGRKKIIQEWYKIFSNESKYKNERN